MKNSTNPLVVIILGGFLSLLPEISGAAIDKASWLADAGRTLLGSADIRAACYWHETWVQYRRDADLKINSSPVSLRAYQAYASDSRVHDQVYVSSHQIIEPEPGAVYHCAYPGFVENHREVITSQKITHFEALAGKKLAWIYFSDDWSNGIDFPAEAVRTISDHGAIPFIRLMAWSHYQIKGKDPRFSMQTIIDGQHDRDLVQWAEAAAVTNQPIIVEFGVEVNGDWFPWNGRFNGSGETTGYGDPLLYDGPERFKDAYRHIVRLFRTNGATNVSWAFHVNAVSVPDEKWNQMHHYYPGDDFVDWIGVSIYGPVNKRDPDQYLFSEIWEYIKEELRSISATKPIAVFEFGVGEP